MTGQGVARPPTPMRVLYVEDNRINAILFAEAVGMRGDIELRVAEDGEEALELLSAWTPELLVLDAHLPGMSGFDVLRQLRAIPALTHVPAYMCSADALPEDLERARLAGFNGYWTKPIDLRALMTDLDGLFALRSA